MNQLESIPNITSVSDRAIHENLLVKGPSQMSLYSFHIFPHIALKVFSLLYLSQRKYQPIYFRILFIE